MKNSDVVRAWAYGNIASTKNLTTNGRDLYSYQLLIGFTSDDGERVVLDYTAPGGHFFSVTTSQHVNLAKREGSRTIMNPTVYEVATR